MGAGERARSGASAWARSMCRTVSRFIRFGSRRAFSPERFARVDYAPRMFCFTTANPFRQLTQVAVARGQQLAPTLTHFVDQRVGVRPLTSVWRGHASSSIHSISGVTTRGVRSPSRRLITVRCVSLFGLARWRIFQVKRKSKS